MLRASGRLFFGYLHLRFDCARPEGMLDLGPRQNQRPDHASTSTEEEEQQDFSSSDNEQGGGDDNDNVGGVAMAAPQVLIFSQTQDGKSPLDRLFMGRPAIPPPRYAGRYSMWDAPPNM